MEPDKEKLSCKTLKKGKCISIIIPARNEEENLPSVYSEVSRVMSSIPYEYEAIIIDNSSTDNTEEIAVSICDRDANWKYIRFSRDFSPEISIAAGLRYASGDAAIVLFSDLQDPPDRIPDLIKLWEEGNDIVYGKLKNRGGDSWLKGVLVKLGYLAINMLTEIHIPVNATDFRLYSREVMDAVNLLKERNRYMRGFSHWVGFKSAPLEYDRRPRKAGRSASSLIYLIFFTINAITTFSIRPLRIFSFLGLGVLSFSIILAIVYLLSFFMTFTLPGLTTVYLLLLLNLGFISLGFGILGEYIGNIYKETKQRPLWIIKKTKNLDISKGAFPAN